MLRARNAREVPYRRATKKRESAPIKPLTRGDGDVAQGDRREPWGPGPLIHLPEPPTGGDAEVTMSPETVVRPVPQIPEITPQDSPGNDRLHRPRSGAHSPLSQSSIPGFDADHVGALHPALRLRRPLRGLKPGNTRILSKRSPRMRAFERPAPQRPRQAGRTSRNPPFHLKGMRLSTSFTKYAGNPLANFQQQQPTFLMSVFPCNACPTCNNTLVDSVEANRAQGPGGSLCVASESVPCVNISARRIREETTWRRYSEL